MLVKVLVAGLNELRLGLKIRIFRLVELSDSRLAVLILRLHQIEGSLRILYRFKRRLLLRQCIQSVVIYLLDFLIERLLGVVELQLLILALDFRRADTVTRLEAIKNGNIQVQTDVLREIVLQLCAEIVGLETTGSVVVRAHTATDLREQS